MEHSEILSRVDHTLLKQTATFNEIKTLCDEAIEYRTASVCIPPTFVLDAKKQVGDNMKICTVIGFPNGYNTTKTKAFETEDALQNGADEIDMVINLSWIKEKKYDDLLSEITLLKKTCGEKILKVIIETCFLTTEEKIKMCEIVSLSGADFIKTSTGFGSGGATAEDIELFRKNISKDVKIKAAGGIKSLADAEAFINIGASRLGTSSIIKIIKNERTDSY